jgi:hypothetical protein
MTIIGGIVVCGLIIITITLACILHTNLFGGYQSIINSTILYLVYSGLCLSGFALIRLN